MKRVSSVPPNHAAFHTDRAPVKPTKPVRPPPPPPLLPRRQKSCRKAGLRLVPEQETWRAVGVRAAANDGRRPGLQGRRRIFFEIRGAHESDFDFFAFLTNRSHESTNHFYNLLTNSNSNSNSNFF